jgi:hypothetical protein
MPLSSAYQQQLEQQQEIAQNVPASSGPPPGQSQQQQPNQQDWDYKTSPVNQKGEALPAGAKQWTPFGQPYFGPGLGGTLRRYAWSMMGSPSGQNDERWAKFQELTKAKDYGAAAGEFIGGVYGTDKNAQTAKVDFEKVKQANARLSQITEQYKGPNGVNLNTMPSEVKAEFEELQETIKSGTASAAEGATTIGGVSLLAPLVRGSKVAVQATLDILSEAAVKVEQAQGVTSAMRDYAQENSGLPAVAFEIDRQASDKSEAAQEISNIASRLLLPALTSWDAMRFWTAPGTTQEKIKILGEGWDAGRILYSQAIKPSLLEEFKRRAAAGEDPQLLAMELQNPWAEMVGQGILDPLNVIGAFAKGAKAASMLDDATDAVRGGSLGDEAAELLRDAGKAPLGETTAAGKLADFDNVLTKNIDRIESQRLTVDFNKATSYSPTGLRVREAKAVQSVSNVVTGSIMRNGGTADDVADFFHNVAKAVSPDEARRLEAWDEIMTMSQRFGLGRYAFGDDVLETGIILRNLTDDKDLLTALKAGKGDLAKTADILNSKLKNAIEKQIPSYTEVKNLAENFKTGKDVTKRAEKAAETYKGIKNKALWNLHEGTVGKAKSAINKTLGKFYFSQPGFAVRNAMGNFTTMFVDNGLTGTVKAYGRDGKFWTPAAIEDDLRKWFGGELPPGAGGMTMIESEQALTGVAKFNDNIEKNFAKRIYWKNFKDTMDKFMTPGVALPKREEFKAIGLTDEMIDQYVHILKTEAYGNTEKAVSILTEKLEPWKRWNGAVSPEEMKGLSEVGISKEIGEITSNAQTPQEITEAFRKLKRELATRANSATDNPIGVNADRKGFEWTEGISRATEQGMVDVDGTNKLNILIEQSEHASEELMKAIGKARDTVTDPALRQQFEVMEEAFSPARRGLARTTSQQLTDTAWDLTKKSKNSTGLQLEALWNKSILAKSGPPPAGLTDQRFRDELWKATRNDVSNNWETYFSEGFDQLTPLIDNLAEQYPGLQNIFAKSQKSSAELNMYRTAIYKDGKIFYAQPPKNIRELASRYGIATAAADGRPMDKQLLATINKYADQKYKTLDEVPLEEAERALQARRSGAMTTADAARVEGPKAAVIEPAPNMEARYAELNTKLWDPNTPREELAAIRAEMGKIDDIAPAGKQADAVGQPLADELGEIREPTPNPEVQIQPPYVDGSTPIPGQMWKENADGIIAALNKVESHMLDNYGMQAIEKLDGSQLKALKGLMKDSSGRITEGMAIADKIGKEWRDFTLLPYGETKNFDLALSYAFPYQFWYSRSYANWGKRVATDPQVIANYARIKESMSRINKDSPEWWRYNVEIPSHFLGLPNEHPMSFNLEANIWPLYGLTGTDFTDPQKRQNWMTATVDDMGKMGPSLWSPIQWAIALGYKAQGEDELAQAWGGRIIPQTSIAKNLTSTFFGKPMEFDPGVQLFSGKGIMDFEAMDKYERNRVGRALTAMVQDGILTEEQAVEVARTQEGPAWDAAVKRAVDIRTPGAVSSFFLGVGMKARTEEDRITDEFYEKYYRLQNLNEADLIAPETYQQEWDALRDKYPFMDALLLSRKAGPDRDRAYAYNVLGRIPPGQASELYKLVGIDSEVAQKFYDSKGDIKGWSESEREKFIAATVDLGAMLSIPDYATKADWNAARNGYKAIGEEMKRTFGPDIQDKVDELFSLEDKEARDKYTQAHPEVSAALQWQNEQVVNNEDVYEFYGGIQAIEKYHKGRVFDTLEKKYGADIQQKFDSYYDMQISDPAGAKSFYRQHPELKAYNEEKKVLMEQALRQIVEFGARLPEQEPPQLTGNDPQSVAQQNIQDYAQTQTQPFEYWQGEMPEVSAILADYWTTGEEIPYAVRKNLDYQASQYGYQSGDDMLQAILISMNR